MWKSLPMRCLLLFGFSWLAVFTLTRLILLFSFHLGNNIGWSSIPGIMLTGWIYDSGFILIALAPFAILLACLPDKWIHTKIFHWLLIAILALFIYSIWFISVSEWIFWDEFGVRFNFIAVDYLVYSDEVVANIQESYPLVFLLSSLGAISILSMIIVWPLQQWLKKSDSLHGKQRWVFSLAIALVAATAITVLDQNWPSSTRGNTYARELSRNGPFQFFAAFRHNELDYQQFYTSLAAEHVGSIIRNEVATPRAQFTTDDKQDIRRFIDNPGEVKPYNIMLVTIESLSAKYLGSFGDLRELTPNLDKLRKTSIFFNNFYATGTRTDRGLEAITLSVPPTPGRSILKRLGHEKGYASLGQQLAAKHYDSAFIYGGRGYFDNMNNFFAGNGYRIVDQSSVAEADIHFKNAWGMSDEDLYAQAIKQADIAEAKHQPFFFHLMTTSNHRPYTYPDGRIDIPSGSGRDGAVKYTDYAIGEFLANAKKKSWFNNTIFVFVADHCAGSAGHEDLPIANYHIPLWLYAPTQLPAQEIHYLASQIDIAPTLLGLLNMDYESNFYGRDLFDINNKPGRALIGNYQHLGLYDGDDVAILSPKKLLRKHDHANGNSIEHHVAATDALIERDIAYYQSASYAYQKQLNAWQAPNKTTHIASMAEGDASH